MTLPTISTDVWKPATEANKLQALATLGSLPARSSSAVALDEAGYFIALDGTTRHGLSEAVRAILQGKLGHAFFPSPAELRMQHDAAMAWHVAYRERVLRREQLERERPPEPTRRTEAEKRRQAERMAAFHARVATATQEQDEDARRAEVRGRYGMTDECLARLPDAEVGKNWTQIAERGAA